jgi:hypothetical protein
VDGFGAVRGMARLMSRERPFAGHLQGIGLASSSNVSQKRNNYQFVSPDRKNCELDHRRHLKRRFPVLPAYFLRRQCSKKPANSLKEVST